MGATASTVRELEPDAGSPPGRRDGRDGGGLRRRRLRVATAPDVAAANELVSLYVDRHVPVLQESAIVSGMDEAFDRLDGAIPGEYRDGIIATGPSAAADMGELVKGAHGPKEVRVILVEDA